MRSDRCAVFHEALATTSSGRVGGALARTAWTGFLQAARELQENGTSTTLDGTVPFADITKLF